MRWPWQRKTHDWQILPQDYRWDGSEARFFIHDGWEPFGVTPVPNTLDPNRIRIWTRRRENVHYHRDYEVRVSSAGWGGHQVLLHLTQSWEPFAVSDSSGNHIVWFRKLAE